MKKAINILITGTDKFSAKLSNTIKNIGMANKKLNDIGKGMTVGLTLPLTLAGGAAFKLSRDLNAGMANVATMIPNNITRIKQLKTAVQDLAIETGKSTGDIASGLYQTISTFQDSADTVNILRANTKAAVAGLATVSDAINLTSSVTQVWGDTSAKAIKTATDFAFQTAYLGKATFPQLAGSISTVTLPAKTLGVTLNEMFAALAHSSNITNKVEVSSTQFASALRELLNPSKELTQLFDYLGYKSGPEMIKGMGGIVPTLQKIQEEAARVDMPLQKLLGRSEAMMFAMQFTGKSTEKFNYILKNMSDTAVAGATDRAFKEQSEGINKTGHSIERTIQRLSVSAQKFGDAIAPVLDGINTIVTPLLDWLSNLSPATLKVIGAMGAVIAISGPLIAAITGIGLAVAVAGAPLLIWPAAIAAGTALIAGAVTLIVVKWKSITTFFSNTWEFLKKLFHSRIAQVILLANPVTVLPTLIINNWSKLKDGFGKIFDAIKSKISEFWDYLKETPFYTLFVEAGKIFGKNISDTKTGLKTIGTGIGSGIKYLFGNSDGTAFFGEPTGAPAAAGLRNSLIESRRTEINKSESVLKVDFSNLPQGTTVRPDGKFKNIDLNLGLQAVTY